MNLGQGVSRASAAALYSAEVHTGKCMLCCVFRSKASEPRNAVRGQCVLQGAYVEAEGQFLRVGSCLPPCSFVCLKPRDWGLLRSTEGFSVRSCPASTLSLLHLPLCAHSSPASRQSSCPACPLPLCVLGLQTRPAACSILCGAGGPTQVLMLVRQAFLPTKPSPSLISYLTFVAAPCLRFG